MARRHRRSRGLLGDLEKLISVGELKQLAYAAAAGGAGALAADMVLDHAGPLAAGPARMVAQAALGVAGGEALRRYVSPAAGYGFAGAVAGGVVRELVGKVTGLKGFADDDLLNPSDLSGRLTTSEQLMALDAAAGADAMQVLGEASVESLGPGGYSPLNAYDEEDEASAMAGYLT